MNALTEAHERLGATFREVAGRRIPARYARAERTHLAVRSAVGVTEHPWGVLVVEGDDRGRFLGDTVTCRLPREQGAVSYGFLLDPQGRIETDLYIAHAGDRFLCLTPGETVAELADFLAGRTFIQDVSIEDRTAEYAVLGVHGPASPEKFASVLVSGSAPAEAMTLDRGAIREEGVTLVRLDAPAGEPGVAVVCRSGAAAEVLDALVTLGAVAAPFGYDTWLALTLEAGTPLYAGDLAGRQPNACGQLGHAVALDKGCFVGQEVVARVANLAEPGERLVGLEAEGSIPTGGAVVVDGREVGGVTRSATSPVLDRDVAFAAITRDALPVDRVAVVGDDTEVEAAATGLPFVEGSEGSARVPRFDLP